MLKPHPPILCLFLLIASLVVSAQPVKKEKARSSFTERIEFGMRGTIQIVDSYGELFVEGWDQPEVELVVTKSTQKEYPAKDLEKKKKELERVKVSMERLGESKLLVLHTQLPSRTPLRPMRGRSNLRIEYKLRVPRTSRLMIKHDAGIISIVNMEEEVEATNRFGQVTLTLPEEHLYAIDARVKVGDVNSEFGPETERQKLLGAKLAAGAPGDARRLYLRVGIGQIQVKKQAPPAGKETP